MLGPQMSLVYRRESFSSNITFKGEKFLKSGNCNPNFSCYYRILENVIVLLSIGC